jgi:hypothetical protein
MAKFLIEVPHEVGDLACVKVVQVFLATGSHFLANAEWGCMDGDHRAWMVVDVETREEARAIVPPAFRANAKIVRLERFFVDRVDGIIGYHTGTQLQLQRTA